jgi:tetratricopeptide (TPR) repeat protein
MELGGLHPGGEVGNRNQRADLDAQVVGGDAFRNGRHPDGVGTEHTEHADFSGSLVGRTHHRGVNPLAKRKRAFLGRDAEQALQHLDAAAAEKPDSAAIKNNQGLGLLEKKDEKGAIQKFMDAADTARKKGDAAGQANAYYNLGETLKSAGKADESAQAYLKSLDIAKSQKNEELELNVRKKLEELKNDAGGGGGDGEDESDDSQGGGNQNKDQSQEAQHPKYESKNLSQEDAKRVMEGLSDKEKELQQKLMRGDEQGKPKSSNMNDW